MKTGILHALKTNFGKRFSNILTSGLVQWTQFYWFDTQLVLEMQILILIVHLSNSMDCICVRLKQKKLETTLSFLDTRHRNIAIIIDYFVRILRQVIQIYHRRQSETYNELNSELVFKTKQKNTHTSLIIVRANV